METKEDSGTMPWTPSESDKRAEKLMLELKDTAEACGVQTSSALYPMYHARVFDLISKALDEALGDGAERDVLEKVVGNGHAPLAFDPAGFLGNPQSSGLWVPVGNGHLMEGLGHADPVIEAHEEGPGAPSYVPPNATVTSVTVAIEGEDAPKKKRGRPKGSKAKKAKPAKAKKLTGEAAIVATAPETPVEARAFMTEEVPGP